MSLSVLPLIGIINCFTFPFLTTALQRWVQQGFSGLPQANTGKSGLKASLALKAKTLSSTSQRYLCADPPFIKR